jgi:hypothetical protein
MQPNPTTRTLSHSSPSGSNVVYTLLALAVLAISLVPVGGSVFVLGLLHGDSPCIMCWQQRIGMTLIALVGLFILRYGARPKYLGLSVLVAAYGVYMSLRHTALHAARDVGQGFSIEVLGAHTYSWALLIFWFSLVAIGVLLLLSRDGELRAGPRTLRPLDRIAMLVFLVVIAGNAVQAFASSGPPPYVGLGDPIRFSPNPRSWVWSADAWRHVPLSLRGRWAIEKPAVPAVTADPGQGPFGSLPVLTVKEQRTLSLPLRGAPTDLAYDSQSDSFLLTTQHGVYLTDGALGSVRRHTVVDPGFSVDLGRFAGAAFLGPDTVIAVTENKSYVVLRENGQADAAANFRYFLESFESFDEVARSRFGTVRARMMYVMSAAFDPGSQSIYTVTVPNSKTRRLVVSRFDRRDLTLSEEFVLRADPASGLSVVGEGRSMDELYVTGATIAGGRMYALSAAYSTLLTVDLASRSVVAAHAIPGIERPVGLAINGDNLFILNEAGTLYVAESPAAGAVTAAAN